MKSTQNINIENINPLTPPQKLKQGLEASEPVTQIILKGREEIINVLNGTDERLLVILGPCSIHDEKVALDYAKRLSELAPQLKDRLCVVMRVYFEKPRTTVGWKGLINDPYIDGSYRIEEGLKIARRILLEITKLGLPTATEFLDPIVPQYISDLVCWAAIGARTTESQTHREMASGLSMPVGYKNSTDGNLQVAINAMQSASHSHHFLGISKIKSNQK